MPGDEDLGLPAVMPDTVSIQIPGYPDQGIETNHLPPVGTRFMVHKHLTDGGTYLTLEVTGHEWRLEEPSLGTLAYFSIRVLTKIVK